MNQSPSPSETTLPAMGSDNHEIIEAAVEAIDPPAVSAPESWRAIGIDLQYDGQLVVRLRPAGDDATDVEVFSYGGPIAAEHLHKYRSAERLAELVEAVHRRAVGETSTGGRS
jgi:hypothetical protein